MFVDFNLYVEFLGKKKMTPTQFAICWMVFHRDYKNIAKYNKEVGPFSNDDIRYLIKEGYLLNVRYKDVTNLHIGELMTSPQFSDEILIENEFEAMNQLKEVYPKYFIIGGKKQLTTACDMDALARIYFKKIKGDKIQHKIILAKTKIVAKMMENGELNYMKIDKYVLGKNWDAADLAGESSDIRREI